MIALEQSKAALIEQSTTPSMRGLVKFMKTLQQEGAQFDHLFTPGLLTRSILMRAGVVYVSEIHKKEHPFVVTVGEFYVWAKDTGWQIIKAPFMGVTKPGTARILVIIRDTVFSTFHTNPSNETDLTKLKEQIVVSHEEYAEELDMKTILSELPRGGVT